MINATAASAELPLHHLEPAIDNPKISSRSHWDGDVWCLDNLTPGAKKDQSSLNWKVRLSDGTYLTDKSQANLLDQLKRYVWSLFCDARDGGKLRKPGSLGTLGVGVRYLAAWMVRRGYAELSELDSCAAELFRQDLVDLVVSEAVPHTLGSDGASDNSVNEQCNGLLDPSSASNEDYLSHNAAYNRICILTLLWQQRDALTDAGVRPPPTPPFGGDSARKVADGIIARAFQGIPPLPDEVALPIMAAAHRMMAEPAEDIIQLQCRYLQAYRNSGALSAPAGRAAITSFAFSVIPGEERPWHEHIRAEIGIETLHGFANRSAVQVLRNLILDVRNACVIVLQSQAGMRINELCALPAGCDPTTGIPICVEVRRSKTELSDLFFLKGRLAKTEQTPREVEWLIGSRPVGFRELPGPVRALKVLDQLFEPWRSLSESNDLIVAFTHPHGLPKSAKTIGPISSDRLRDGQKDFARRYVDLSALPDTNAADEDLAIYRQSKGTCLRTHQWRKSFALYCFRLDSRMTPAIAQQFQHLSLSMTEEAYIGSDPLLLEAFNGIEMQQTVRTLYQFSTGKSATTGHFSNVLEDHRKEIEAVAANAMNRKEKETAIGRWCIENDIRIHFSQFGKCYMGVAPKRARCHELAGTLSWSNSSPNSAVCCPETCLECYCFAIDGDHAQFWINRYVENQRIWEYAVSRGYTGDYRIAKHRADQSKHILERLQIPLP